MPPETRYRTDRAVPAPEWDEQLDAVRGLAALGAGGHFAAAALARAGGPQRAAWETAAIVCAAFLPVFLFLSARLCLSSRRRPRATTQRLRALLPPYAAWTLLSLGLLTLLGSEVADRGLPLALATGVGHLQFLHVLAQAYLAYGVLKWLLARLEPAVALVSALLISVAWCDAGLRWSPSAWTAGAWAPHAGLLPAWLPALVLGGLAARARPGPLQDTPIPAWSYWPSAALLGSAWVLYLTADPARRHYLGPARPDVMLAGLLFTPLLLKAGAVATRSRLRSLWRELGWNSPAIYLVYPALLGLFQLAPVASAELRALLYGPGAWLLTLLACDTLLRFPAGVALLAMSRRRVRPGGDVGATRRRRNERVPAEDRHRQAVGF